ATSGRHRQASCFPKEFSLSSASRKSGWWNIASSPTPLRSAMSARPARSMSTWTSCSARRRTASRTSEGLRLVRPDPHELLAEVCALQEAHERGRRAVEAFGNELLVLDLALANPLRHVLQEVAVTRGKVADDEAADGQALGQDIAHHRRRPFRRHGLRIVVMRDQAAHGHAR